MISIGGIFNTLSTSRGSSIFPSGGGEISFVDGDTVMSFSANSTLVVYEPTTIQYFIVGGGGAGAVGSSDGEGQGGGGAGEVLSGYTTLSAGTYTITIGSGGEGWTSGSSSSIGSSLIARGGKTPTGTGANGADGYNTFAGGDGDEIDTITYSPNVLGYGGGGAGSTQNGQPPTFNKGAYGGSGTTTSIRGYSEQFAGGGGGGVIYTFGQFLVGEGVFGGGNGSLRDVDTDIQATNARVNSGAGGGGGKSAAFGKGGSGIVIIRF